MSEEMIVKQCSPTLAGLKTGNMFVCTYMDRSELLKEIRAYNKRLSSKGVRFIPLRTGGSRALIYVYRPDRLKKDLADNKTTELLGKKGYPLNSPSGCVSCLREHIVNDDEFPHEIGLFLGYPPEDVIGFIENKAGGHKLTGAWKVYGNVKKAKKTFAGYEKCTRLYEKLGAEGTPIESLAVAG